MSVLKRSRWSPVSQLLLDSQADTIRSLLYASWLYLSHNFGLFGLEKITAVLADREAVFRIYTDICMSVCNLHCCCHIV